MSKRRSSQPLAVYRLPKAAEGGAVRARVVTDVVNPDLAALITALAREQAQRDHQKAVEDLGKAAEK